MRSKTNFLLASVLALSASGLVRAADAPSAAQGTSATASAQLTAGEVRKVDAAQGKLTIRHEAIENLQMPAMTMVFRSSRPELLKDIKAGDKIRFRAETVAGAITLTEIETAR